ncbi:hypothetical protein [Pseudomonas sp.]|uniref:hypothetical protein n=1 Tax=Pseudomonas sp. TaxID=306 RepID=UPI003FD8EC93
MNRTIVKSDAELMMDAGIFMSTIAGLIADNVTAECSDEPTFLNSFRLDGLMKGLKLAGNQLCGRSEDLTELVEKEEAKEEEMTKAAQQRRQGRDSNLVGSVGAECGRACTA